MVTARILSFTTLVAMAMGACSVSSAEEVKDSTSTEIVSVESSDLRNEDALRVAVGDFDDVEFLLSAEEMEAIADNVYISFNGVSAQGGGVSGSSISSAEASGQVEATQSTSTTFNGALTLASATSETVTVRQSAVASLVLDNSTEQYATDAGKSYYEQVSTSNSGSAVTTYSATSFLGNSNSVGDGNGSYGTSYLSYDIVPYATNQTWTGSSGTVVDGETYYYWSNSGNWSNGGWTSGDNATFDTTGSSNNTVTVDKDISAGTITVTGGTSYTFNYAEDATLEATGNVTIGNSSGDNSSLTIEGGENKFRSYVYLGYATNSTGSLTITGGTNTFSTSGDYVYLGYATNSTGSLTITGGTNKFSNKVYVGMSGTGTIEISGGDNTFSKEVLVGYDSGSNGTITISGGENKFSGGYVYLGYDGKGTLTILDGKNTFSKDVHLAYHSESEGTITISGGENKFSGDYSLYLGYNGKGTLTINGGTNTFTSRVYVAYSSSSTGTITISGGTNKFSGVTDIGNQGEGKLTISAGTNTFSNEVDVGKYGTGTIEISGGDENTFSGTVYVGYNNGSNGTITIEGGTNEFSGTYLYLGYNSGSTGSMTISGTNTVVTVKANLYIGDSGTGKLTISDGENTFSGTNTYIGYKGEGRLEISGGTNKFSGSYAYLGYNSGSTGSMTISGTNTVVTVEAKLYVGNNGTGTLTIEGGTNTFSKEVLVGYKSTGTLEISNGNTTFSNTVYVGYDSGSAGYVTISGGTTEFSGTLNIGRTSGSNSYTGTMTITGGSTTLKGATTIANNDSSLSVSGGTLTIEKQIGTSQTGSVTFSETGKLIVTQTLLADAAGELNDGEKVAVAVITANTITFGSDATLEYNSSESGYVTDLVSNYITVQSGDYRVTGWYYYADNGTLYAITMPEPSMFGVFAGLGAIALTATRRRRRRAA